MAVVVSFNGGNVTRETVEALVPQVGHVHIVDNGSDAKSLEVLRELEEQPRVSVQRLGTNRGVGYALNAGYRRARENGFEWLLTMDQDSLADLGMVPAYMAAIEEDPSRVCLTPTIYDDARRPNAASAIVEYAITSGNLVRIDTLTALGTYEEEFFVDCIDFDFSLRLRRAGFTIYRLASARLRHRVGLSTGAPPVFAHIYEQHAAVRRYYKYRNYLYLAERYAPAFPWFILKLGLLQGAQFILIAFLDPRPIASYRAIARGVRDYCARRVGACDVSL